MTNVGDVIKLKSGEHAVVVRLVKDIAGFTICECMTGNGVMVSKRESEITDTQRTKHKVRIESVLDTLKVFDRAAK